MKPAVLCLLALTCCASATLDGFNDRLFCPPGYCLKESKCFNAKTDDTITPQAVGALSNDFINIIENLLAKGYTQDKCKLVSNGESKLGACPDTTGMIGTCAMMCNGDDSCGEGMRCCSNGCGRACMKVAVATPQPATTTSPVAPASTTESPNCGICPAVLCKPLTTDKNCIIVPAPKDECGCSKCPFVVCREPATCETDVNCGDSEFCQRCRGGADGTCEPKLSLGETCGGFIMCPGTCHDDFKCVTQQQPPFGPQMSDMPGLCCPPKSAECKCGDTEYMLHDEHGCNSCKCMPSPCGERVAPIEDAWCSPNNACDDGQTCKSYKGPFGENHVCCPKKELECAPQENLVLFEEEWKCCPQVACRMYCPHGWAWKDGCPNADQCGCYTPEDTCVRMFDGCNECGKDADGEWSCTEMSCKVMQEPKCLAHEKPKPVVPKTCYTTPKGGIICPFIKCAGPPAGKKCKSVTAVDECGCDQCPTYVCEPVCGPVCDIFCEHGHVIDENNCPTCECEDKPVCGPVCKIFCEHGNVLDASGCPTCACIEKPDGCGPACPIPMCVAPPEEQDCEMIAAVPDKCGCVFCPTYECKAPTTASPGVTTRMCKDGSDDTGAKCACKSIGGCSSCSITSISGEERTEKCMECAEGRFSVGGKCPKTQVCKGEKLEGTSVACKCRGVKYCHACIVTTDDTQDSKCLTCKKDSFFHEGSCLETCPAGLAHVGKIKSSYGRSCQKPHTCVKGVVTTEGHPRFGKKCRCHSTDCLDCAFNAHESSIQASCNRCTNKLYHHEGQCTSECANHLTHHGLKKAGRACLAAFQCSQADAKSRKCHCAKTCKGCSWEAGNTAKQHSCLACRRKKLVPDENGQC